MLFYAKTQNECRTRCAAPCGTCPGRNGERPRVGIHPVWAGRSCLLQGGYSAASAFASLHRGGFVRNAARRACFRGTARRKGDAVRSAHGGNVFVALWIAALAQGQTEFTSLSAVKGVAMMSAGAIGGYLGIALRERRRRIH